ncbi:helix-turn-helix domain-containing protein [Thaumasiovibrio sp. DFM-14]|uniref:helix-turn-helix domain-containing protein n=1 Tax=Thaumasiovibrio sp. DFM-14 TaxID=3384792 RepID=UPI0039A2F9A2
MSSQPNNSIIDGITCLQALASSDRPVGCRELSRQLNLQPMKVNRILQTLVSMGIAIQDEKKAYLPGPGIHVLAAQAIHGSSLLSQTLPAVEAKLPCEHIISVGVLWQDKVSYLVHTEPDKTFSESLTHNHLYDATKSTIGIQLLSSKSDDEIVDIVGQKRFALIKDKVAFSRIHGYSKQYHEDPNEVTIAITLDGNSSAAIAFSRFQDQGDALIDKLAELKALAVKISGKV